MCVHALKPTESLRNYARWQRSKPICVFIEKVIAFEGTLTVVLHSVKPSCDVKCKISRWGGRRQSSLCLSLTTGSSVLPIRGFLTDTHTAQRMATDHVFPRCKMSHSSVFCCPLPVPAAFGGGLGAAELTNALAFTSSRHQGATSSDGGAMWGWFARVHGWRKPPLQSQIFDPP